MHDDFTSLIGFRYRYFEYLAGELSALQVCLLFVGVGWNYLGSIAEGVKLKPEQ